MLVVPLANLLATPVADPMVREVVAVPTRGVERWLAQSLSHHLGASEADEDGVCANIDWPFPGALVYMATAAASGMHVGNEWRASAHNDPWSPGRLVWPIVEVLDECLDEEFLRPVASHLRTACGEPGTQAPRRFATARHIADLYDSYSVHRPEMVLSWLEASGPSSCPGLASTGLGGGPDSSMGPQPAGASARRRAGLGASFREEDVAWQAELFRRVRQRVGAPSLAERLMGAAQVLSDNPELIPLPARLFVFGLTRLPPSHLSVLRAIAARREVHLFLLHPSGALWDSVEEKLAQGTVQLTPLPAREDDPTAHMAHNALLRSWGRDAREMQLVLASQGIAGGEHLPVGLSGGPSGACSAQPSLLSLLQAGIRADIGPPGPAPPGEQDLRPVLAEADKSVQVHACHGRARQVEVVRDAVLHLLAEDATLEPRDVIVMCPDIELFAPLVAATFAPLAGPAGEEARGPVLRARLADRSLRQTNPLLAVAAALLELAAGRVSAPQVLDFASAAPVRRRFKLKDEDLARIAQWARGTGDRWGLDASHREAWKLGRLGQLATWRLCLDRLLLGVAMAGSPEPFEGLLALEDVSSTDIDLAGRFAELMARLHAALQQLSARQSVRAWAAALTRATESLACPTESWQHDEFYAVLSDVALLAGPGTSVQAAGTGLSTCEAGAGTGPLLDLAEVTYLLSERLRGRPTRANFRTGDMTACTLVPMRSVPHRVVCLLGLDGAAFPRRSGLDGDDLLAARARVGDRDAPSEDRQLLLDALLAAKDHLVLTYEGRDQRQNLPVPPAVPVAELLDTIDRTVRHPDPARPAREMVVVEHPLQPFDPRNYTPGELGSRGPWRFDRTNLEGAIAFAGDRQPRKPFLDGPLAWQPPKTLQLSSLVRFLESPVRAFLRERLGLYDLSGEAVLSCRLPLELGPLSAWALGNRLLASVLAGKSLDEAASTERARGLLPPGALGEKALGQALETVASLLEAARGAADFAEPARSVEVNVCLPGGRELVGTVRSRA